MTALLAPTAPPAPSAAATAETPARQHRHRWLWPVGLVVLGLAAAAVGLWDLANGQRSEYYAAIALSMSEDWRNWLFGALDPSGTISLDKIPGSFWIPALFVRMFGFSTWSVNAPNALATVGAALVTAVAARRVVAWCLPVARTAAATAGLLAGLLVAATPIVMAVGRSNQPESMFVLCLALVAWTGVNAVQRRSLGWLLAAGAAIALAFQMYMLEAWAAWPALGIAWLLTAWRGGRRAWWRRGWQLLVAGAVSAALSVVWIVIVTLTPASARPYVGGTYTDSAWEMVFGYNGLGRFAATSSSAAYRSFDPPFAGSPGLLRLFNDQVGGQIGWLIPAAIVAIVALARMRIGGAVLVWIGGWFATMLAMFSVVDGMHQFYTAALAIPIGILVGAAWARAQQLDRLWPRLALLGAGAGMAIVLALRTPAYLPWAMPTQLGFAAATALALVLRRVRRRRGGAWVALLAALGLALTPAAWAVDTISHPSSLNPVAGDGSAVNGAAAGVGIGGGRPGRPGVGSPPPVGGLANADFGGSPAFGGVSDPSILAYVEANRGSASILLATFGAQPAATFITASGGEPVIPIGGFSGTDPAPTLAQLQGLVTSGQLRYVLVSGTPGGFGSVFGAGRTQGLGNGPAVTSEDGIPTQIRDWVLENCSTTPITDLYACGTG